MNQRCHQESERVRSFILRGGATFKNCYEMAQSGLYYIGPLDLVQCHSCGIKIWSWKEDDIVDVEHIRLSPSCFFMKQKLYRNSNLLCDIVVEILHQQKKSEQVIESLRKIITTPIWGCDEVDKHSFQGEPSNLVDEKGGEEEELDSNSSAASCYNTFSDQEI